MPTVGHQVPEDVSLLQDVTVEENDSSPEEGAESEQTDSDESVTQQGLDDGPTDVVSLGRNSVVPSAWSV